MSWETSVKETLCLFTGRIYRHLGGILQFVHSCSSSGSAASLNESELAAILSLSLNKSVFDTVPQVHLLCP